MEKQKKRAGDAVVTSKTNSEEGQPVSLEARQATVLPLEETAAESFMMYCFHFRQQIEGRL